MSFKNSDRADKYEIISYWESRLPQADQRNILSIEFFHFCL